jgi:Fungal specific transcription factor domain
LSSSSGAHITQLVTPPPFSRPTLDLLDALPPRHTAELLISVYTDFRNTLVRSLPMLEGSVAVQFEALYELEPKIDSYACVAIVYLMFAIGLQFLPFESRPQIGDDIAQLHVRCYRKAREAVGRSDTAEPANLERISAILMLGVYLKTEGRPNDDFHLIGQAVRLAQSMVYIMYFFFDPLQDAEMA